MRKFLLAFLFIVLQTVSFAQYFNTGQDPASIRWRQIKSVHFNLIYPDYYESVAQQLAGALDEVYPFGAYTLKHNPAKFPVILHTRTVQSNGLIAWAPRRAEFYTMPHQAIYPQDWLRQLVLHEFRHIVQIDKVNDRLPAWVKTLFGEQATALFFGTYLPWWLIEGDAVVTETSLSDYGRGRFPSFLMEHRALHVEKGRLSYDKAYLGSYRDFIPDYYKLGYYLVGSARIKYGLSLWEEVFSKTGSRPLSLTPVNSTLKSITGQNKVNFYHSVFDSLRTVWINEDCNYPATPFKILTPVHKYFTNYNYNHWYNDSILISFKRSFDKIPSFIKLKKDGGVQKIMTPGNIFEESVNYRGEWIVYSEKINDPRWQHGGKSLIRLYNIVTNEKIDIVPEFNCFSPAISPSKSTVAVVEADYINNYYLSFYDISEGKLIYRYRSPSNNYFMQPEWVNDNEVVTVILTDKGKRIARINPEHNEMTVLFQKDIGDIKHLKISGDYLYFISSYSGKNSLYRMNLHNLSIVRVFEPRFGVESPAISEDGEKIVLSNYTSDGFRLIEILAVNDSVIPLSSIKPAYYKLAEELSQQEEGKPIFTGRETNNYLSEKYRKASNLFNFHSWAPLYIDPNIYEITPGASLVSQNLLGTAETVIGYKRDLSEKSGKFLLKYSYKGFYPVIDINFDTGNRKSIFSVVNTTHNDKGEIIRRDTTTGNFKWREINGGLSAGLPLNFTKGRYNRYFFPVIKYDYLLNKRASGMPGLFPEGDSHSIGLRLYFHQLLKQSYLDMYPDFGIMIDGNFKYSHAGLMKADNLSAIQGQLYIPGIAQNHGMKIYGGIQRKVNNSIFSFSDIVKFPRGWNRIGSTLLSMTSADYKFPLLYPDFNLAGIMYFTRIKTSLFADYGQVEGNIYQKGEKAGKFKKTLFSTGTEIVADTKFLRFYAPSEIGVRTTWLPERDDVAVEFLLSIDFNAF